MKLDSLYTAIRNKIHLFRLRLKKGIKVGEGTSVYYKCAIDCRPISYNNGGECSIGKNCLIGRPHSGYHAGMPFHTEILLDGPGSKVVIGNNCRINGAYIHSEHSISIGDNCVIASGVNILDSNGHKVKSFNRTEGRDIPKEIEIGNNVWICMNAILLKGSKIGDNSIISAGSVVQGEVPANSIVSSHSDLSFKSIIF